MNIINIIEGLQKIISKPYGIIALIVCGMGVLLYRQQNEIDDLRLENKSLNEKVNTAYSAGQDDAIHKVGEQIKVIQSMGIIINQSIEQTKQNNNESKKLNKQLDNLKHELK